MPLQKQYINGNAIPRRTGMTTTDLNALYGYLWNAMEQLRYVIEQLEKRTKGKSDRDSGDEELVALKRSLDELHYAAAETAGGAASRTAAIPMGSVDATSTATAFTATVPGITSLYDGVCVWLTNGVVTSASGFTININGLGALPVYQSMAAASRSTTIFNINYTMLFIYNASRVEGGCWDVVYGYNSDTNTVGYNLRQANGAYKPYTKLYRYQILFSRRDGTLLPVNAVSNKPTTYTKALTTESFDPFGQIWYYSSTGAVDTSADISLSSLWGQYSTCDLRYSFNLNVNATPLTANAPVYLVTQPQNDGLVKLATTALSGMPVGLAQALPGSEDGKVYIYLGRAYSTYQIALDYNKRVYYYKAGAVRLWDGNPSAV